MKAYFFVDSDGTENVSNYMPIKRKELPFWIIDGDDNTLSENSYDKITELPRGTIKSMFDKELTYDDDPIVVNW